MILCDSGVLLCLVDSNQPKHDNYKKLTKRLQCVLITTWACLAEVMYLSLHRGGWNMQKQVGQMLLDGILILYDIPQGDYGRILDLMECYRDRPMDLADATLVLTAENTGYRKILTIDSDFLFYRISGQDSFEIINY
jgi:uncharacterized protein